VGYSLGWVAVRGRDPQDLRTLVGGRDTRTRELPGGWHLVIADRGEHFVQDALLARLSAGAEAVGCFLEEHVMYSAAVGWVNGQKIWSVMHDSARAVTHLQVAGDAPPALEAIRQRRESAQRAAGGDTAQVDHLFEVPIELAKAVTGYRHDEDDDEADGPSPAPQAPTSLAAKPAWWKRWLG
jgi:hypothetical protein